MTQDALVEGYCDTFRAAPPAVQRLVIDLLNKAVPELALRVVPLTAEDRRHLEQMWPKGKES